MLPLTGGGSLPLLFIGGGLLALGLGAAGVGLGAVKGLPAYLHPSWIALTHLWLPGFLLSVCFGATYQLMPVILGVELKLKSRWLWCHLVLHIGGLVALVSGLHGSQPILAASGGTAIVTGVVILVTATLRTFWASQRRDVASWCFVFAASWLLLTVGLGVVMALNRRYGFMPLGLIELLRTHAHLGLIGYFVSLLQGVSFQLIPMFTLGETRRLQLAWWGLLATQLGLPVLALGLAGLFPMGTPWGASIVLTGGTASGVALAATFSTRRRRKSDVGIRAFLIGLMSLGMAGVAGLAWVFSEHGPERALEATLAYGLLWVVGGLSFAVLGMLLKILPFLVWMKAYGPKVGRTPVPIATALSSRRLEELWFGAHSVGLALLLVGIAANASLWVWGGGVVLMLGLGSWLANAIGLVRHWIHPRQMVSPASTSLSTATSNRSSIHT